MITYNCMSIDCNISIANLTLWKPRHGEEEVCPLLVAAEVITSRSVLWQLTVGCLSQHNACMDPACFQLDTQRMCIVRVATHEWLTLTCCIDLKRDFETEWKLVWTGANWSVVAESTEWPSHSLILVWCMRVCIHAYVSGVRSNSCQQLALLEWDNTCSLWLLYRRCTVYSSAIFNDGTGGDLIWQSGTDSAIASLPF